MQFYVCVSVILASIFLFRTDIEAATGTTLVPANPNHPGKCYDSKTDAAYAVGETWRPAGSCVEYKCSTAPENNFQIEINGCSPVAAEPPCRVVSGNASDPFPLCCYKVVCN